MTLLLLRALYSTLLLMVLVSCSSVQRPQFVSFDPASEENEVEKGSVVVIRWKAENAEAVVVDDKTVLGLEDSIQVVVSRAVSHRFVAKARDDSSTRLVHLLIREPETPATIDYSGASPYLVDKKVPVLGKPELTDTWMGVKIMGRVLRSPQQGQQRLRAIGFDRRGFWKDLDPARLSLSSLEAADNGEVERKRLSIDRLDSVQVDAPEIRLLIERSFLAAGPDDVELSMQIRNYLTTIEDVSPSQRVKIVQFNQKMLSTIGPAKVSSIIDEWDRFTIAKAEGLSSLYEQVLFEYKSLEENPPRSKTAIVVVCAGPDNTTTRVDLRVIEELAQKTGVPLYTIYIGDGYGRNEASHLAALCGGRTYMLGSEDFSELRHPLIEISVSAARHDEIVLSNDVLPPGATLEVRHNGGLPGLETEPTLVSGDVQVLNATASKVLTLFDFVSEKPSKDFQSSIESVGRTLSKDPSLRVVLTGHDDRASVKSDKESLQFSLRRCEVVKQMLVDYGATPRQIDIRAYGARKPLFFDEEIRNDWKVNRAGLNRRVEMRWIDERDGRGDYVIRVGMSRSEEVAEQLQRMLTTENVPSYIEREYRGTEPRYSVYAYGFKTKEEASAGVSRLRSLLSKKPMPLVLTVLEIE